MLQEDYSQNYFNFDLTTRLGWEQANQTALRIAINEVRSTIEHYIACRDNRGQQPQSPTPTNSKLFVNGKPFVSNLDRLCRSFGLSNFERQVLLLAAARESDGDFARLCGLAYGNENMTFPSLYMALSVLPNSNWNICSLNSVLFRWELIRIVQNPTQPRNFQPITIDERIMDYLLGFSEIDRRLKQYVTLVELPDKAMKLQSHIELAEKILKGCAETANSQGLPTLQLCGSHPAIRREIAFHICAMTRSQLYEIPISIVADDRVDTEGFLLLWEREAFLNNLFLLIDCENVGTEDAREKQQLAKILRRLETPVVISSVERVAGSAANLITFDIPPLTPAEQRQLWYSYLGEGVNHINEDLDPLIFNFQLSPQGIQTATTKAFSLCEDPSELGATLWQVCREQSRPNLDELADRMIPKATWDDLILPEAAKNTLREMIVQVKHRSLVYEKWGFGSKSGRGFGISSVFAGPSGTGKTMGAEVIAKELNLDLYRVDLSSITSKYIGETEKNLGKLFDAADASGVILLFDEGESLFGKRSEVKDSKDRNANQQVNYLLQRLEAYRGLAIITTNIADSIDVAFLRRLRFIVTFPFPGPKERMRIWKSVFPKGILDIEDPKDFRKLARLQVAGGLIKSIAMRSAFMAAEEGSKVKMTHLLRAAESEYTKLGQTLVPSEVYDWVSSPHEEEELESAW